MDNQLLPKNHFLLKISTDIKAICQPLEKYSIEFFVHMRCFDDGSIHFLATESEVGSFHLQQGYPVGPYIPNCLLADKFSYLPNPESNDLKFSQAYYDYKNKFQISYPFYLFERYQGYVDYFHFSTDLNNPQIINFYLNRMDLLESFKVYFKNKADMIFQRANRNRIILPQHMRLNFKGLTPNDEVTNALHLLKNRAKDINQLLYLHFNTKLTIRELQSLSYLIKGRTAAETAQILRISPKTVEYYIDSVKAKLNCLSRADLFDKVWGTSLLNILAQI